mgnify:CR=1 FL=1
MEYRISIKSSFSRGSIESSLLQVTAGGPFLVRDLMPVEPGLWTFSVVPERPAMAIGFAKLAEFLVLLAREFEVHALDRAPLHATAAAS